MHYNGEILIEKEGRFVFIEDINLPQKLYPLSIKTKKHVEDGDRVVVELIPCYEEMDEQPDYIARIIE